MSSVVCVCVWCIGLDNLLESAVFTQKEMMGEAGLGEKIVYLNIVFKVEIHRLSHRQLEVKKHNIFMMFLRIHCGISHTACMCAFL